MTVDRSYRRSVQKKYDAIQSIWEGVDPWHLQVHSEIVDAIRKLNNRYPRRHNVVLDIGAGGNIQPISHNQYVQLDISLERLRGSAMAVCADAHSLPFSSRSADCVVCVGPAVNYCSLIEVIAEIARVAKDNAPILFHIELSNSLEFAFTRQFRARATLAETFYKGTELVWLYSNSHVIESLESAGLRIVDVRYFHVVSALVYRMTGNIALASRFGRLDPLLTWLPGIGAVADSGIFTCEKGTS